MGLGILCGMGSGDRRIADRIKKWVKPAMSNTLFGILLIITPQSPTLERNRQSKLYLSSPWLFF
jgi:hypothetical protein